MFPATYFPATYLPGQYFPPGAGTAPIAASAPSTVAFTGLHTILTCEKFQQLGMNSTQLIEAVRNTYMGVPSNRLAAEDSVVLAAFDKVIRTTMYPRILAVDEGYYMMKDRVLADASTGHYRVPKQAHDGQIAKIEFDNYELAAGTDAWSFEGDSINLTLDGGTVVIYYYVHPPRLAEEDYAAQIQTIDYETGVVTVNKVVPTWLSNTDVCLNIQSSSRLHDIVEWDVVGTVSVDDQKTITLPSATLKGTSEYRKGVRPGDYLTDTGYSFFPLVPPSLHDVLVSGAAAEYAKRLADPDWTVWKREFQDELAEGLKSIDRRSDGLTKVINPQSTIRRRRFRRFR